MGLGTESDGEEMTSFDGRLRLPGQTKLPVGVVVDISNDRMKLTTGDRVLGDWPLKKVNASAAVDGFHLDLDGEAIVLNMVDPASFAFELGVPEHVHRVAPRPRTHSNGADSRETNNMVASRLAEIVQDDKYRDLEMRIGLVAEAMISESVSPEDAYGQWLGLLKEINSRHGEGSMPNNVFHRFNTRLLDLMPEPARQS